MPVSVCADRYFFVWSVGFRGVVYGRYGTRGTGKTRFYCSYNGALTSDGGGMVSLCPGCEFIPASVVAVEPLSLV